MEADEFKESRPGDSREAILNAAEARFAAAGIDSVSMREIAGQGRPLACSLREAREDPHHRAHGSRGRHS